MRIAPIEPALDESGPPPWIEATTLDAAARFAVEDQEDEDDFFQQPSAAATPLPPARADTDTHERLAALEARIEEQDAALRRVLTLLVDWVETEKPPQALDSYFPIRGAAA